MYSDRLADVRRVVTDVAAWQIEAYPRMDEKRYWKSNGDLSWENGVFLSALASWAEFDGNGEFIEWYESVCERNRYQLSGGANRIYFADDLAVALMYARLYMKRQEDCIIHPTVSRLEFIMNHPSPSGFYIDTPHAKDRWSWCDALYMAPPVFAAFANITCNPRLREFMDREYCLTVFFSTRGRSCFTGIRVISGSGRGMERRFFGAVAMRGWLRACLCLSRSCRMILSLGGGI